MGLIGGEKEAAHCELGKITTPKKEGGLGVTAARPQNVALLAKLNWRMHVEKDQNWAKV